MSKSLEKALKKALRDNDVINGDTVVNPDKLERHDLEEAKALLRLDTIATREEIKKRRKKYRVREIVYGLSGVVISGCIGYAIGTLANKVMGE